jgi:NADH:ubiquinone oxidoreductase subunit K
MSAIGLPHFLVVSAALFALGLVTVSTRRNAVAILMGVELMLNAGALNFVAFAQHVDGGLGGQVVALFVIVMAAAEAAIALAIVLNFYNNHLTVDVDTAEELKG